MLYYQPRVNLRTGAAIGAEALIRWQHPQRGLLLPQEFLPAIEDDLLAVELGERVIETALTQMDSWRASGLDPIAVSDQRGTNGSSSMCRCGRLIRAD